MAFKLIKLLLSGFQSNQVAALRVPRKAHTDNSELRYTTSVAGRRGVSDVSTKSVAGRRGV